MKQRAESGERRNDLVDLSLDAMRKKIAEEEKTGVNDDMHNLEATAKLVHKIKTDKQLDELIVVSNSIIFLIAGYDTTAITLAVCAWQLARNPDIQQRLHV